jgi:hypothetical protein
MKNYDQPLKNEARQRVLSHAVQALTEDRINSPVVTHDFFDRMINHCRNYIYRLTGTQIDHLDLFCEYWKQLHRSRIGQRMPIDLQVLYLSGPEPLNDIKYLRDLGVSLHNIWAIEGDKRAYAEAEKEIKESKIPIKLHNGTLSEFLQIVPQQFDIVYFDACGPLFGGSPNTIHVVKELFQKQRLNGLSVLISNFSEANRDGDHKDEWSKRLQCWYSARYEQPVYLNLEVFERFEYPSSYQEHIERHLTEYYSDFITRFIIEFAAHLLPWWRVVALPAAKKKYFAPHDKLIELVSILKGDQNFIDSNYHSLQHSMPRLARRIKPLEVLKDINEVRTTSPNISFSRIIKPVH